MLKFSTVTFFFFYSQLNCHYKHAILATQVTNALAFFNLNPQIPKVTRKETVPTSRYKQLLTTLRAVISLDF